MTYLEQAFQFQVEVVGPVGNRTITSIMEERGFECYKDWMKQEANDDWLESKTFNWNGETYILTYNRTKLSEWRKAWKAHLRPGEPSYKPER